MQVNQKNIEKNMRLFQIAAEKLEREYQTFLDYIAINETKLSQDTEHIGKKDCYELNRRFEIVRERYESGTRTQNYYCIIDFFCFFSLRYRILQLEKGKGKSLLLKRGTGYDTFAGMTAVEKYTFMAAVWFGEYMVLEVNYSGFFKDRIPELIKEAKRDVALEQEHSTERFRALNEVYIPEIRLLALFHFIEIEWMGEDEDYGRNKFRVRKIFQTEEGLAMARLFGGKEVKIWYDTGLELALPAMMELTGVSSEMKEKVTCLQTVSVEPGTRTIEFKIEIGSCVRRIEIGDQYYLDDLHYVIQKSVNFDMDHMYLFEFGAGTLVQRYFCQESSEGKCAEDVTLAELPLYEGMQFRYLFDFGDKWWFKITVKHIVPQHTERCVIYREKGRAPKQYSS